MIRGIAILTAVMLPQLGVAKDYVIRLNLEDQQADYRSRGLQDRNFDPNRPWETWGSTARDEGNFPNQSSKTLRAIRFKIHFPGHVDRPRFSVQSSGGRLFGEVWMNSDGTDILFRNSTRAVSPDQYFWMQVQPATSGAPGGYYQFEALAYESNPPIPTEGGWAKVKSSPSPADSVIESEKGSAEDARRDFFGTDFAGYTSHFNFDNRVFSNDPAPPRTVKYNCFVECILANGVTRSYSNNNLKRIDVNDWRVLEIDRKKVQVVRCRFWWSLSPNGRLERSNWVQADDGMYISYVFLVWHGNNDYTLESLNQEPLRSRQQK